MCTGAEVNGQELPLSYTIGLAAKGHPELMLFGLQMSLAQPILSYFAVKQTEGKLALDTPLDELGNLPLILKAVAPAKAADFITMANHRAGREVSAIQIFWPDPKGLFPWEPGFDAKFDGWQPLLFMSVH